MSESKQDTNDTINALGLYQDADVNPLASSCGVNAIKREILPDGSLRFTFPDLDRSCGDCSLWGATVTISAGAPYRKFEWKATVSSSDDGDTWLTRLSFRDNTGNEIFTMPNQYFQWFGMEIRYKDNPVAHLYTDFTSPFIGTAIPVNFLDAVDVYLSARC